MLLRQTNQIKPAQVDDQDEFNTPDRPNLPRMNTSEPTVHKPISETMAIPIIPDE